MRKLVLRMSMSLDAFVAGPNGEKDWIFNNRSPEASAWLYNIMVQAGVHIMGSRSFNDMKGYWPLSNDPLAAPMNDIPKVVFTRKGLDAGSDTTAAIRDATAAGKTNMAPQAPENDKQNSWLHPTVAQGDMAQEIKKLKAQPGGYILAHGGAGFAQSLIKTGLVDEYHLFVHPVVLGRGLPIFSQIDEAKKLELISSTPMPKGVLANVYRAG
jgi:dihydrofolate reductase